MEDEDEGLFGRFREPCDSSFLIVCVRIISRAFGMVTKGYRPPHMNICSFVCG